MDVEGMLKSLREEREKVDMVIASLERLQAGAPRRRGRPPLWLSERRGEITTVPSSGEPGVVVKKRRGRPPKNATPVHAA
jgi:hypothetical protein